MKDMLKDTKGKISINIFRTIAAIGAIVFSVITYRKNKNNKKMRIISIATGIAGIGLLAKEVESDFKPVEVSEDDEQ